MPSVSAEIRGSAALRNCTWKEREYMFVISDGAAELGKVGADGFHCSVQSGLGAVAHPAHPAQQGSLSPSLGSFAFLALWDCPACSTTCCGQWDTLKCEKLYERELRDNYLIQAGVTGSLAHDNEWKSSGRSHCSSEVSLPKGRAKNNKIQTFFPCHPSSFRYFSTGQHRQLCDCPKHPNISSLSAMCAGTELCHSSSVALAHSWPSFILLGAQAGKMSICLPSTLETYTMASFFWTNKECLGVF